MELTIQGLCMNYGTKEALKGVSFTLTPGVYGLLGPNGAGKSTLMNILTGNLTPTKGDVLLNGHSIRELGGRYREKLGYMPQQQVLYPSFTVSRFLSYMAALRGMTTREARNQIPVILEKVALQDVAGQKIKTLSGGMKQRLLIAQAILASPDVLILDEPTAGLDPKQRIAIRNLIAEVAMDKIVLIATHVVSDVEFISKEILLLRNGQLLRKDTREALTRELRGRVFELEVPAEALAGVAHRYQVGNIAREEEFLLVRVLADAPVTEYPCKPVRPTLEDVYLHCFGE
jgi:ABC-type multidrug transport system ATPase subunit